MKRRFFGGKKAIAVMIIGRALTNSYILRDVTYYYVLRNSNAHEGEIEKQSVSTVVP